MVVVWYECFIIWFQYVIDFESLALLIGFDAVLLRSLALLNDEY